MFRNAILIVFLLCASQAFGATSVAITTCGASAVTTCGSSTTITTGLAWDTCGTTGVSNCTGTSTYPYSGTTLTVSGSSCTSGAPCTWTITDQNGTTVQTVSASGAAGTAWPTAQYTPPTFGSFAPLLGSINCTGSSSNTVCIYNAPQEWPPAETATITINGGALGNATVTVNFNFDHNLQEYFKHRARILGWASKPLTKISSGNTPFFSTWQPEQLIFQSTNAAASAIEEQFVEFDNAVDGTQFPTTAGSEINRPAYSYDGKWFSWVSSRCNQAGGCGGGNTGQYIQNTTGGGLKQISGGGGNFLPQGFNFTYDYHKPNLLVTSDSSDIDVLDLNTFPSTGPVSVATYTGTQIQTYSQVGGANYSQFQFRTPNSGGGCSPILTTCSSSVSIYDLTACESSVAANCATIAGSWNSYLSTPCSSSGCTSPPLIVGYEDTGTQHCDNTATGDTVGTPPNANCEWHFHDINMQRNTSNSIFLYGQFGSTGEGIGFQTGGSGSGTVALYPNTGTNAGYFSHPSFDWSGNLVSYSGSDVCQPSGHACGEPHSGHGVWDTRQNKAVIYDNGLTVGHDAWDGFDENQVVFDGRGPTTPSLWSLFIAKAKWNVGSTTQFFIFNYGTRDIDNSGNLAFGLGYGPSQSADGTKACETMKTSFSNANRFEGYCIVADPQPPVRARSTTTSAATIGWLAHPLNHETQAYHVYKQASCSGTWSRIADVNAVYLQSTEYTTTDSALATGQNACYGVSSSEWNGNESHSLSNIVKLTCTAGTPCSALTAVNMQVGGGTVGFDVTAPANATSLAATLTRMTPPSAGSQNMQSSTGGSMTAGTYWFRNAYCNYSDYPATTAANLECTTAGTGASVVVPASGLVLYDNATGNNDEAQGETAIPVYGCGPSATECTETLQTCTVFGGAGFGTQSVSGGGNTLVFTFPPNWLSGRLKGTGSGEPACEITSIAAGAALPGSNASVVGYNLTWTKSTDDGGGANDVRYYLIFSRDTAAPILSGNQYSAQQWLIATVPAGTTSFLDYTPNWYRIYNSSGGPFYGIETVDREGNISAGSCYNAATSSSTACN